MMRLRLLVLIGALQAGACGSSTLVPSTGSGGADAGETGGQVGTGGRFGTGGAIGAGGAVGRGGAPGTGGAAGSPGSVTFVLTAPPPASYCDQITCPAGGTTEHLTIITPQGEALDTTPTLCGITDCNTCSPLLCPLLCPAPEGVSYTGGTWTWDGSILQGAVCGASRTTCSERAYAAPGRYVAHFCATPGSVVPHDAGLPTCVSAGPAVCVDTSFDFPGSGTVAITLPAPGVGQL